MTVVGEQPPCPVVKLIEQPYHCFRRQVVNAYAAIYVAADIHVCGLQEQGALAGACLALLIVLSGPPVR